MNIKFRMFTDGKHTYAEIGGKTIGKGIQNLSFTHLNGDTSLHLDIDIDSFEFMADGYFDKAEREFLKSKPPSGANE